MIHQLFRTKFESNLTPFIVFLALNALLGLMLLPIDTAPPASDKSGFFAVVTGWLLFFCVVAGGLALLRYNRERGSRLYAQLPVTARQVRVAYWCHAALYLCISSLVLLLVMFFPGDVPLVEALLFTALYFFHAGVLLAVVSIVTSNTLRLVPEEIRRRTVIYFFLATFIVFVFMFAIGLLVAGYTHVRAEGVENWPLLTLLMAALGTGLVILDVHLFGKKDNHLD